MAYQIHEMSIKDYKEIINLLNDCEGVSLDETDDYESLMLYIS